MLVQELAPGADEEFEAFLLSCPGGLFFHSPRYRDLLLELLGAGSRYLVARNDGGSGIRGVLPLMHLETPGGRIVNSLPYFGSHGDVVAATPEAREVLSRAYGEIARARETRCATLVRNPFSPDADSDVPSDYRDSRISQATELPRGGAARDAILGTIDKSARRNVRKAESRGVSVREAPEEMGTLAEIHRENMDAIGGQAKSGRFFELVPRLFRHGLDYRLYAAEREGEVVAMLLLFYFGETVEYFVPAIRSEHRSDQPLSAILAHAMAEAARLGYRLWNWGGTQLHQTGVYRFKRKWASRESRYRYETVVNDTSLLRCSPTELLESYAGFYTVPFSELKEASS